MGIFYVLLLIVIIGYCVYLFFATKDKNKKKSYCFGRYPA